MPRSRRSEGLQGEERGAGFLRRTPASGQPIFVVRANGAPGNAGRARPCPPAGSALPRPHAYQALFRERTVSKVYEAIAPFRQDLALPMFYRSRLQEREDAFMQMQEVAGRLEVGLGLG